jgi:hypothetical protein
MSYLTEIKEQREEDDILFNSEGSFGKTDVLEFQNINETDKLSKDNDDHEI